MSWLSAAWNVASIVAPAFNSGAIVSVSPESRALVVDRFGMFALQDHPPRDHFVDWINTPCDMTFGEYLQEVNA